MTKIKIKKDIYSAAYPSSTLQQNFGEDVENHGFLVWNIESPNEFNVDEYNIENEHNYINFTLDINTDYNNLNLNHKLLNEKSEIKIKWKDISANVNFENEIKIRQYFKEEHNINNVKIIKNSIYTDVSEVQMVNESIDVLNLDNQRKIFIEYLELNGHDKEFINDILKIDDIINDRLKLSETNLGLSWSIDKIWFENFKSYGDLTEIDFKSLGSNSLIQIGGLNQGGKTTILDAICYILYGKTTTTLKREKNGDNRYINNKRDLNFCNGGAVITINNETYTIFRETERKISRDKINISSCSTNVDYYIGDNMIEENKLTDERKSNTQQIIDNAIGDFSDFVRLVLTTADNLNDLLSMDRSIFMDSIIRDAGYDIFEKKLNEFKDYKKELYKNRINIDIENHNFKIKELNDDNEYQNFNLSEIISEINELELNKPNLIINKEETIKKLEKIDESLYDFQLEIITENVKNENEKINKRNEQLNKINKLKEEIKSYSSDELDNKKQEQSDLKDLIAKKSSDMKDYDINISQLSSQINTINSNIKNVINSYITDLKIFISDNDTKISKLKEDFNTKIIQIKTSIKDELNDLILQKNNIKNEIDILMEQGKIFKIETESLQNSLDKVCITCNRTMDSSSVIVVNKKINDNKNLMLDIMNNVKTLKPKISDIDIKIDDLNNKLNFITNKDYSFDKNLKDLYDKTLSDINDLKNKNNEIEKSIELIKNENIPTDLKIKLETYYDKKNEIIGKINDIELLKNKLSKEISIKSEELETLSYKIKQLIEQDTVYKRNMEIIGTEDRIKLDIERSNNIIEKYNTDIEKYNKELDKIQNNINIKNQIDKISNEIDKLDKIIKEKNIKKTEYESKLLINNHELNRLLDEIKKYEEQKKQDELLESYVKCVHRDGIPTHLLKMSIHIINEKLNNILTDVDFTIFFDDELNIKLSSNNKLDVSQNVIESSGKERTFSSVALKIALRSINNKSRPNLLIFDEIMGKLIDVSVEEFVKLLETVKNDVDKLIIIEHVHSINYDYIINVTKDEQGISSLSIE